MGVKDAIFRLQLPVFMNEGRPPHRPASAGPEGGSQQPVGVVLTTRASGVVAYPSCALQPAASMVGIELERAGVEHEAKA
jgi:hypothetical protein